MNRAAPLLIGLAALLVSVIGAFANGARFFDAYLFGYLFWLGLALGCFGLLMLNHLVGGKWGFVTRRFFEAGLGTLPLMAILFVPLLFALRVLYGWARPDDVAANDVLQHRHVYLNIPFFIARVIGYFAVWLWLTLKLRRGSHAQDATSDIKPTRNLRTLSGPGLVIYVLITTFAYIDLVLSLESDWYSTIFPILIIVGQALSALAFSIMLLAFYSRKAPLAPVLTPAHFHDLGNLLLAFVMLWAYMSFAQFLIIWNGNMPDEISWYLHRSSSGWKMVALVLGMFHFAVPFALLLSRESKRRLGILCTIACAVLLVHVLDVYWLIAPSLHIHAHWLDFTLFAGIGGLWLTVFAKNLAAYPLLPLNDPRYAT